MYQQLTLYKIAFLNVLLVALLFTLPGPLPFLLIGIAICLMNGVFLAIVLYNLRKYLNRNTGRLLLGRKRTLIVTMSGGYILIAAVSLYFKLTVHNLFIFFVAWTILVLWVYLFANPISSFLHKIFKKKWRYYLMSGN